MLTEDGQRRGWLDVSWQWVAEGGCRDWKCASTDGCEPEWWNRRLMWWWRAKSRDEREWWIGGERRRDWSMKSGGTERIQTRHGTGSLGHRVTRSFGSSFTSGSPGHHFDPVWDPSFSGFGKKCPKCKAYFWNADMTKIIVRCLLLDWNHWMSVHAINFYFYLWLLKKYLAWECFFTHTCKSTFGVHYRTGSPGQLGLWVAGSQNVTQFHVCCTVCDLYFTLTYDSLQRR